MASLLSVTANSLSFPSTPFKGNVKTLMPKPPSSLCVPLKVQQRNKPPQLTVLNQATSETVGPGPVTNVRFRLNNLGPQPGSRKSGKRKGRGIAAGQGNSCGFGMRGQKSRSGPGVRKGFEGGQMPLYRRIPKLRGIAGGEPGHIRAFPFAFHLSVWLMFLLFQKLQRAATCNCLVWWILQCPHLEEQKIIIFRNRRASC